MSTSSYKLGGDVGDDTTYIAGLDTDRRGDLLKNHKLFISVGHDECWSLKQRTNVEAARDAGLNLAFMSGNEVFWHIRYEDSIDGSKTPLRTLVVYKETHSNQDELGRTIPTTKSKARASTMDRHRARAAVVAARTSDAAVARRRAKERAGNYLPG